MGDATGPETIQLKIPVIDISGYLQGDNAEKTDEIVKSLRSACQSPGFFQITGHNVAGTLRKALLAEVENFFALPNEQKQALHRGKSHCLRGYESVGEQMLEGGFADQKEGFMIGPELPDATRFLQGPNQWPPEDDLPEFRNTLMEYFHQVHDLSRDMFRLMALSLGLEEKYFDDFVCSESCKNYHR
jgi:isopenicillin N synthase-like dioxygenase